MVKLSIQRLKEILKEINTDPQTAQQYYSRLSRILNFLNNNTGLKNAAVKETGSRAKKTDTRKSDIDVIFCTSPEQDNQTIRNHILEKAISAFGKAAEVNLSGKAVHVDFQSPKCNFDLVYLSQKKFIEEKNKIKEIIKLKPVHKNAIKLVKYAFDKSGIKDIKGYEVEKACLVVNSISTPDCVKKIVKYFKGRIEQNGFTIENVLQRLK